jgi:hypothetical protein
MSLPDSYEVNYRSLLKTWEVREVPSLELVAEFPLDQIPEAETAAKNFALAMMGWLDSKPDPALIAPFYKLPPVLEATEREARIAPERLAQIIDDMEHPEHRAELLMQALSRASNAVLLHI